MVCFFINEFRYCHFKWRKENIFLISNFGSSGIYFNAWAAGTGRCNNVMFWLYFGCDVG